MEQWVEIHRVTASQPVKGIRKCVGKTSHPLTSSHRLSVRRYSSWVEIHQMTISHQMKDNQTIRARQ